MRRLFVLLFATAAAWPQNVVVTVAGTDSVFDADGRRGTQTPLGAAIAVSHDRDGNPVVADPSNHVVLVLRPDGTVRVVAGNGLKGFSGDGGQARSASLRAPAAAVYDAQGNLYLSEPGTHRCERWLSRSPTRVSISPSFALQGGFPRQLSV